jgi:hypothetical protein
LTSAIPEVAGFLPAAVSAHGYNFAAISQAI